MGLGNDYFPHQQMVSSLLKSQSKDRHEGVEVLWLHSSAYTRQPTCRRGCKICEKIHCLDVRSPFSELCSCVIKSRVLYRTFQFRTCTTDSAIQASFLVAFFRRRLVESE